MTDEQAAALRKLVERGLLTAEQAARIEADCAAPGGPEDPVRAAVARGFLREDALRGLVPRGAGAPSPSTPTLEVTVTRAGAAPAPFGPAPERLGRFEILEEIGRGGMGIVYRGWDADLSRVVALKVVQGISTLDDPRAARFRREAQTVARLRHPNIVQVHEVGEDRGRVFLSLEYIKGTTLGRLLQDPARDLERIVEVLAAVCDALDFAHREGVVHRDVKPENVLLDGQGRPYLADFGLAKEVFDTSRITASGDVVGTPAYMAPEQARGTRDLIGPATDIYAVGAILYEALTGRPPFRGEGIADIIYKVVNDEPERPSRVAQGVPEDLESICLMCLQKEPSARYVTARDLAEDLRRHLQRLPVQARHPSALSMIVRRTLKRRRLVAASLLAAVAIGASLWAWWRRGGTIELSGLPPSAAVLLDGRTCPSVASGARLDLSAGRHELSVTAPGYATWTQSIDLSRGELLRLPCGATRKVGTALFTVFPSDATVRLQGPGGIEASTPLGLEGPPLPTGAWTARATAPGYFPRETAFEVLEGNRTAICLHLDPIVRWEVSTEDSLYATPLLRDFDGDGLPDVWFMSRDRKGRVVSGVDGRPLAEWTVPLRADSSLEAADLDGDGRDEVVYGCDDGTIRAWSFARGAPLWEFKAGASILSTPLLQDVNGDGTADVLMGTTGTPGPWSFHAVDGRTGKALWSRELGDITSTAAALPGTTPPDIVVAVDRVGIVCLRGATGETRWSVPVQVPFYCSVAVGDLDGDGAADVVACSDAGPARGIRGDGKEIWCRDLGAVGTILSLGERAGRSRFAVALENRVACVDEADGSLVWERRSRAGDVLGITQIASAGRDLDGDGEEDLLASLGRELCALSGRDGKRLWSIDAPGRPNVILAGLKGPGGRECLLYGSNQHHLQAYDLATGGLVWQAMLPGPMVSDIVILPDIDGDGVGDVLVTNSGQGLLCRSGADGTRSVWQSPQYPNLRLAGIWPAEGTRKAMVVAYELDEGRLFAFDMKSGRLVYARRFPPSAQFLVHPSLPGLVVVASDGLTRAIRLEPCEVSLPWPSFRHDSGNSGDARR